MEAQQMFRDVLCYVEKSRLNFTLSRTPFSATISLKSSFIKNNTDFTENPISFSELEQKMTSQVKENLELMKKLNILEKSYITVKKEKDRMDHLYEQERTKHKLADEVEAEFRSELLKVKAEKSESNSKLKSLEVSLCVVHEENKSLNLECKELKEDLKHKVKNLTKLEERFKELKKEKECADIMVDNLVSEVNHLKQDEKQKFKCQFCGNLFNTKDEVLVHVRRHHSRCQETQCDLKINSEIAAKPLLETPVTKTFAYQCFYCDKSIESEDHLKKHKETCCGKGMLIGPVVSPCEICDAQCKDGQDLGRQIQRYHRWSIPQFLCNVCPTNFPTRDNLKEHERHSHGI